MTLDWIPRISDLQNKGTEALKNHFLRSIKYKTGESISTIIFVYSDETLSPPSTAYMNSSPSQEIDLLGKNLGSVEFGVHRRARKAEYNLASMTLRDRGDNVLSKI